jgi:hypothetical protein
MMLFITIYTIFSILITIGILKHEQDINETRDVDIKGVLLYPFIWPMLIGILISKVINSDYVLTINIPTENDQEEQNQSEEEDEESSDI